NYVSSYHCVHQRPVLGLALDYLLWRARAQVLAPRTLPRQEAAVDLRDPRQREKVQAALVQEAQALGGDAQAQHAWLGAIAARLGIEWEDVVRRRLFHLMTQEEVADMVNRGF